MDWWPIAIGVGGGLVMYHLVGWVTRRQLERRWRERRLPPLPGDHVSERTRAEWLRDRRDV